MATLRNVVVVAIIFAGLVGLVVSRGNVNRMCSNAPASKTICRVVKLCKSKSYVCRPQPKMLTCVPHGSDKVCGNLGKRAVLFGSETEFLQPLICAPHTLPCPRGSKCVKGHCCYGRPSRRPADFECAKPKCQKPCFQGYSCQQITVEQDRKTWVCLPTVKPGFCPMYNVFASVDCTPETYQRKCDNDGQCPINFKCCHDSCSKVCKTPRYTKLGRCPAVPTPTVDCSLVRVGRFCENDLDCPTGTLKCCGTVCGGTACLQPLLPQA